MQGALAGDKRLSNKEVLNLYSIAQGCYEIRSLVEFKKFVRTIIRDVFPHEMAVCYIGRIPCRLVKLVNIDCPKEFLDCVIRRNGDVCNPIAAWPDRQTPLFINVDVDDERVDSTWVRLARQHQISTAVSHGVLDAGGQFFSNFCFCGIHPSVQTKCEEYVSFIVPHLHVALVRHLHSQFETDGSDLASDSLGSADLDVGNCGLQPGLTDREKQILAWVCVGKTNWEISRIVSISENTVKNHVQNIYRKLGVTNRTQAAEKARIGELKKCGPASTYVNIPATSLREANAGTATARAKVTAR